MPRKRSKSADKPLSKFDMEFLARTFSARDAKGLTQEEMAEKLKLPQDQYKHYESRGKLPHELVPRFLEAADVEYAYLFTGAGKGPAWHERYHVLVTRQITPKKQRVA